MFTNIDTSATEIVTINGDAGRVADGPFFRNSRTRFRDALDGLTNTIFSVRFVGDFLDLLLWVEMSSMNESKVIDWERL